jgi:hypothetical protein
MEIWQPGFHEATLRDAADYETKTRYIHMNPVVDRLVEQQEQWLHSSASGKFPLDPAPQGLKPLGGRA